jgi:hypothetical protein
MGADRVIKTDGVLDITATDTSVSGTLTVSGQSTLSGLAYPTADGTADQVLTTDGSGALSFATVSGGYDEITSNSEAGSYSGTARIIYITASEAVTFTSALSDRIIINKNDYLVKFTESVTNCTIQTDNDIELDNSRVGAVKFENCKINCKTLTLDAEEDDSPGSDVSIENSEVFCEGNLEMTQITNGITEYSILKSNIFCSGDFIVGTSSNVSDKVDISHCNINVKQLKGQIKIPTGGPAIFRAREGSSGGNVRLNIQANTYISGSYAYPFVANYEGIDASVVVDCAKSNQNITASTPVKIELIDSSGIDNTSSFSSYKFTAKVKGFYRVTAMVEFDNLTGSNDIHIYKNGSSIYSLGTVSGLGDEFLAINKIISLNQGDYIELFADSDTDTNYDITRCDVTIAKN